MQIFLPLHNMLNKNTIWIVLLMALLGSACRNGGKKLTGVTSRPARASLLEQYPKDPGEEILNELSGNGLYNELEDRYRQSLYDLHKAVNRDGAKLIVVILTPEVGKLLTPANAAGIPSIIKTCSLEGITCVDLSQVVSAQNPATITQMPNDSHWSKEGAAFVADQLAAIIKDNDSFTSDFQFPNGPRPATFGDLPPGKDEVLEGDKDIQYHLTVNAQGLRMNHNLVFPKKKQTILFLGDSQIFCPYLDNVDIPTELLQKRYPGKEMVNAGNVHYTIEDYLSLYTEKARYVEPDLAIVCTNGTDILDYFFTSRNKYSRSDKCYTPSEQEKQFYEQLK